MLNPLDLRFDELLPHFVYMSDRDAILEDENRLADVNEIINNTLGVAYKKAERVTRGVFAEALVASVLKTNGHQVIYNTELKNGDKAWDIEVDGELRIEIKTSETSRFDKNIYFTHGELHDIGGAFQCIYQNANDRTWVLLINTITDLESSAIYIQPCVFFKSTLLCPEFLKPYADPKSKFGESMYLFQTFLAQSVHRNSLVLYKRRMIYSPIQA